MPKKLIDLDLLKDFRQKYDTMLKNGTLVPAKAQIAEQIANVSEDVGSTQEEPFIFQATATDNGLDSVETAPIAKHLEKQGNSVVVNQFIQASSIASTRIVGGVQFTNNGDGSFTLNGTCDTTADVLCATLNGIQQGRICLIKTIKGSNNVLKTWLSNSSPAESYGESFVSTKSNNNSLTINLTIYSGQTYNLTVFPIVIDLTQWGFTADEITDITAHPEHFFNYYNGSLAYNTGTLTNSNGRYLKCIGRNQWDEEWELGTITNGVNQESSNQIRSKNYTRVIPNTEYYAKIGSLNGTNIGISYYDKDKHFIKKESANSSTNLFTTPSNCAFIRFNTSYAYGTTYNHDITISIYYADGTDYDQYFPYEENTYDIGTEVLRSAGSVRDIKLPNGSITRNVGVVDLGTLDWTYWSSTYGFYSTGLNSLIKLSGYSSGSTFPLLCSKYSYMKFSNVSTSDKLVSFYYSDATRLIVKDSAYTDAATFKTAMSGVYLFYELATPTEESGTSFAENVIVDNYGSMGWLDTDSNFVSVPQGSEFFYPADYVEFLDSLYTRSKDGGTSADVTNIVVQSELTPYDTKDTQLQNAIGGTLRQCLCVKESLDFDNTDVVDLGILSWEYQSTYTRFRASMSNIKVVSSSSAKAKMLSTKYSVGTQDQTASSGYDKIVAVGTSQYVYIKDSSYTSADTFKAAMKGVLLAYEKA